MIKIIDRRDDSEKKFVISIFPDKTSQAWRIEGFEDLSSDIDVIWYFEGDHEFMTVLQLGALLKENPNCVVGLICPFLPYGRQDKVIQNNTTFGREVMLKAIRKIGYDVVITYDGHSASPYILSLEPIEFVKSILKHDIVAFPDNGAYNRYVEMIRKIDKDVICLAAAKDRDQITGEIKGMKVPQGIDYTDKKILVLDDICDGGKTFTELIKILKQGNPKQVDLAVSHGIFSKGKDLLYEAGYGNIYTTNSILTNVEGYKVF